MHRAGLLHRAFSIFIVDEHGRILLQKRSREEISLRRAVGELLLRASAAGRDARVPAARRRLKEELGVSAPLSFGFFSRYHAELGGGMQENEFVYVYFGPLTAQPQPDPAEVSDVEFVSADEIRRRIAREPEAFTYWLRHYFENHFADIARLAKQAARTAIPAGEKSSRSKSGPGAAATL